MLLKHKVVSFIIQCRNSAFSHTVIVTDNQLAQNAASGKELMDGTDSYNISPNVANKIYIPYAAYTGV